MFLPQAGAFFCVWMQPRIHHVVFYAQVLKGTRYNEKADVYSYAILVWELLTRQRPYTNIDPLRLTMEVAKGMRPTLPRSGDPKLVDLMKRCWDDDPSARPSFAKILSELV